MVDYKQMVLGEFQDPIDLANSDANRQVAITLTRQARRSVDIFTRDLDKKLYDNRDFLDGLQNLEKGGRD